MIRSYLAEVSAQAGLIDAARESARTGVDFDRSGDANADDVEAVAWVAEVAAALRAQGAEDVRTRNTRHDYGVFWAGSWVPLSDRNDLGAYLDIIAAHGGWEYVLTIKVGGGSADERASVFQAAMQAEDPGADWKLGRASRANTFRLWKLEAGEMSASQAAAAALTGYAYLQRLANRTRPA